MGNEHNNVFNHSLAHSTAHKRIVIAHPQTTLLVTNPGIPQPYRTIPYHTIPYHTIPYQDPQLHPITNVAQP